MVSGSNSMELPVSSFLTGLRSQDSAMLSAVASSTLAMRTGLPVLMHST